MVPKSLGPITALDLPLGPIIMLDLLLAPTTALDLPLAPTTGRPLDLLLGHIIVLDLLFGPTIALDLLLGPIIAPAILAARNLTIVLVPISASLLTTPKLRPATLSLLCYARKTKNSRSNVQNFTASRTSPSHKMQINNINLTNIFSDAYQKLLDLISSNVKGVRDDVKKTLDQMIATSAGPSSLSPDAGPPKTLNYEDYKHLKYWFEAVWQALRSKHNSTDLPLDSSIISIFMEDELGRPISEAIKARLRGDLTSYWNDIHKTGEVLKNWTDIGLERKDHFRSTFEAKYPWLRLCEASWKVDHLWINHFRTWRKGHPELGATPEPAGSKKTTPGPSASIPNPKPNAKRLGSVLIIRSSDTESSDVATAAPKPPTAKPIPHINIESSDTDSSTGATVGSKRPVEEEDDRNPKRQKGKGKQVEKVDIMEPTVFHHSKPKTLSALKKTTAKLAKKVVSQFAFLSVKYMLKTCRIHCICPTLL